MPLRADSRDARKRTRLSPARRARRVYSSTHDLERRRLVRGAQEADRHRRHDHGRRDEARGREVVAVPIPNASTMSATTMRPARILLLPDAARAAGRDLREDEYRDRRGELQPFSRSLAPQEPPQDTLVTCDHLADDGCGRSRARARRHRERRARRPKQRAGEGTTSSLARARRARRSTRSRCGSGGVAVRCDSSAGGATLGPDIPWMLEPRHVVPRHAGRGGERACGKGVEVGRPCSTRKDRQRHGRRARRRRSSRSVSWKYTWTHPGRSRRRSARARSPSECVVGMARRGRPAGRPLRARRATPTARSEARYSRCARGVQST